MCHKGERLTPKKLANLWRSGHNVKLVKIGYGLGVNIQDIMLGMKQFCPKVTKVEFYKSYMWFETMYRVGLFVDMARNLRSLAFHDCIFNDSIGICLRNCENMTELIITGNPVLTGKCLMGIRNLKIIALSRCDKMKPIFVKKLLQANPQLRHIAFFMETGVDGDCMRWIATKMYELIHLEITAPTEGFLIDLARNVGNKMKYLLLHDPPSDEYFARAIYRFNALKGLNINCGYLYKNFRAEFLSCKATLEQLGFFYCPNMGPLNVGLEIWQFKKLRRLDIRGCKKIQHIFL